ncbi:hypothetical protein [Sporofaciens sp. SGI.106]|nr:hypothetical protein [Lachnoclostridium sp.]
MPDTYLGNPGGANYKELKQENENIMFPGAFRQKGATNGELLK